MKIPLTIEHTKKDLPFFQMAEANLMSLLDIEFEKLHERMSYLKENWIENNKCECVNKLLKGKSLRCEHIKEVIKKDRICLECRDKIERMSSASHIRTMSKFRKEVQNDSK